MKELRGSAEDEKAEVVEDVLELEAGPGLENLRSYLNSLDELIHGKDVDQVVLRTRLLRQMRKCSQFDFDLKLYDRALLGSVERSYEWLRKVADKQLREKSEKDIRRSQLDAMKNNSSKQKATPANATPCLLYTSPSPRD